MQDIIRSDSRGSADLGWLQSRHTFSFADYHNPSMMGYGSLRVINEDWIAPGQGFPTHPHRDMEIVTYMIDGELEHKDNMGNGSVIRAGELQRMSAGTGVLHSEFNPSSDATAHLLQIWILPKIAGLEPGYEQKLFPAAERHNHWQLLAGPDGGDGALTIHQDTWMYSTVLDEGQLLQHRFANGNRGFLQVVKGDVRIDDNVLKAGDALALQDEAALRIVADSDAECLLFEMNKAQIA
ncbi:MAG: pirin family protein [Gammaproteobacteria bacterium]|nr:pirin family protein [Gammaproteobacteria bacterium]